MLPPTMGGTCKHEVEEYDPLAPQSAPLSDKEMEAIRLQRAAKAPVRGMAPAPVAARAADPLAVYGAQAPVDQSDMSQVGGDLD